MAARTLLALVALVLVACGDTSHRATLASTPLVASVATDPTAVADTAGLGDARAFAASLATVAGHARDALELAFGGDGGAPTPADYARLQKEMLARLPADATALGAGRATIRDPGVLAGWDALTAVARETGRYLARGAGARSAAAIAAFACSIDEHRHYLDRVAGAGKRLAAAVVDVRSRFGLEVEEPAVLVDRPASIHREVALAGWRCAVAMRPLVSTLEKAHGATAITRAARAIRDRYRTMGRQIAAAERGAPTREGAAMRALGRWAAVEAGFMDLIIRSWHRHDVTKAMTDARARSERAAQRSLVATLTAIGIRARFV